VFDNHPTLNAVAVLSRVGKESASETNPQWIRSLLRKVVEDLPEWDNKGTKPDFVYWYFGSAALRASGLPEWSAFHQRAVETLLEKQNKIENECRRGSWEPVSRWSLESGRVYATAMGALVLLTPQRF
jgi:hypothetical protein